MGSFSLWHWIIVLTLIMIRFGRGRVSAFMGDLGSGLKDFKRTLRAAEEEEAPRKR